MHCREAEGNALSASSLCRGSTKRLVKVGAPGQVNLERVNAEVHTAMPSLPKKSWTPGFYVTLAKRAADGDSTKVPYDQKASGGFRDVGTHTTAEPLPTCWPLVEEVLHHFLQQARATSDMDARKCGCNI